MKYLNLITDMTSTGNSMGKLFETPYCQNKLKLNSSIELQSILAKTNWKKRDDYNIIRQKIIKKRKKVNWTVLLNLSEVRCCAFYKLRKFKTQEWRDWVKWKICLNCRIWTSRIQIFKMQNIFLVSTKENDEVLKVLKNTGSPRDLQGSKE